MANKLFVYKKFQMRFSHLMSWCSLTLFRKGCCFPKFKFKQTLHVKSRYHWIDNERHWVASSIWRSHQSTTHISAQDTWVASQHTLSVDIINGSDNDKVHKRYKIGWNSDQDQSKGGIIFAWYMFPLSALSGISFLLQARIEICKLLIWIVDLKLFSARVSWDLLDFILLASKMDDTSRYFFCEYLCRSR